MHLSHFIHSLSASHEVHSLPYQSDFNRSTASDSVERFPFFVCLFLLMVSMYNKMKQGHFIKKASKSRFSAMDAFLSRNDFLFRMHTCQFKLIMNGTCSFIHIIFIHQYGNLNFRSGNHVNIDTRII